MHAICMLRCLQIVKGDLHKMLISMFMCDYTSELNISAWEFI